MLDLSQLESFYPPEIRVFKKNILREYLQYKVLEGLFQSEFANKLTFMGETAIRVAFAGVRFSEDLDFDNSDLSSNEFRQIGEIIRKKLALEGYEVETRTAIKAAFHCYIGILNILYENGISHHKDEKLVIRLDTQPQRFPFKPHGMILNKFDVFTRIYVVPEEILLSQKIFAILNRRRTLGRDILDAIYLFGRTSPNLEYLKSKLKIINMNQVKELLLTKCAQLDLKALARDVAPLVVRPPEADKILLFEEFVKTLSLNNDRNQ